VLVQPVLFFTVGDKAAVEAAFAWAHNVTRLSFNRITAATMEPRGCIGEWDDRLRRFTPYVGTQRPHTARADMARRILHIPETQLRVVAGEVGGSFGMKGGHYPEYALALWASRKIERPVKWSHAVTYPLIGDPQLKIAKLYDMLPEGIGDTSEGRTPADNATVRSVFLIGPDKKVKAMLTYPMTSGRNFDEVLRLLDSCQLTAKHQVATPVNWKPGEDVIIAGSVSDEQAREKYPGGWKAPKPYLRIVPQPH